VTTGYFTILGADRVTLIFENAARHTTKQMKFFEKTGAEMAGGIDFSAIGGKHPVALDCSRSWCHPASAGCHPPT
jgi:hypothetical protein